MVQVGCFDNLLGCGTDRVTVAVSVNVSSETFDVSAAFLSRMPTDKSSHIRSPSCDLQSVGESQKYDLASFCRSWRKQVA